MVGYLPTAASGLASKGHTKQAEGIMAAVSNERSKMTTKSEILLDDLHVRRTLLKCRDKSHAGMLENVRQKVEAERGKEALTAD
eukprot:SAG31_NODE_2352_length_5882_cov_3.464465_1_plen_84_part_00